MNNYLSLSFIRFQITGLSLGCTNFDLTAAGPTKKKKKKKENTEEEKTFPISCAQWGEVPVEPPSNTGFLSQQSTVMSHLSQNLCLDSSLTGSMPRGG